MKKTNFDYVRIFTIAIMVIVLAMTFIPINPWSTPPQHSETVSYKLYSFFENVVNAARSSYPFVVAFGILFYLATIAAIVFLLLNKRNIYLASLAIGMFCMTPFLYPLFLSMYFALGVILIYVVLIIFELIVRYKYQVNMNK